MSKFLIPGGMPIRSLLAALLRDSWLYTVSKTKPCSLAKAAAAPPYVNLINQMPLVCLEYSARAFHSVPLHIISPAAHIRVLDFGCAFPPGVNLNLQGRNTWWRNFVRCPEADFVRIEKQQTWRYHQILVLTILSSKHYARSSA